MPRLRKGILVVTSLSEHFVALTHGSGNSKPVRTQVLTRPVGFEVDRNDVLVGIDAFENKHLLVPIARDMRQDDEKSSGVSLTTRVLRGRQGDVLYLDLACLIPELDLVFERLAEDVLSRIQNDSRHPYRTTSTVLAEWRALLKAGTGIGREEVIGLIGELEVLSVLAERDPIAALDAWKGPSGALHDFTYGAEELEVKSTCSTDGNLVTITHMDQLDPALAPKLHLAAAHMRVDESAPKLDDRIDALLALGVPRDPLISKVADAGYLYESRVSVEDRYVIRTLRLWPVDVNFPGLRRAEISPSALRGVTGIRYELALDAAPPPLDDESCRHYWDRWS